MRIGIGIGTEVIARPQHPQAIAEEAAAAENDGFRSAWCVHFSRGIDALSAITLAGMATRDIALGSSVIPTYPRHPLALAQQAATVQAAIGGRLTLGIGLSHRPVIEGMFGLPYASPARHMREYLSILGPMLREGRASFDGRFYRVDAEVLVPGTSPVPIVVAALGPAMLDVAGELADGTVTWMAGPRTLGEHIAPRIAAAAGRAGRSAPRVIVGVPVAVCDDVSQGRTAASELLGRYDTLANYQRLFEREGVGGSADIAVVGDEGTVEGRLRAFASAGATELWCVPLPVGDDPDASFGRTRGLLKAISVER